MTRADQMKFQFRKRFLSSPLQVVKHILRVNIAILKMIFTSSKNRISSAFRERLNLAVCGVNECVYCTHLHTKTALAAGVTGEQAAAILSGETEGVPAEEARAVAFARYWADSGGWYDTDRYVALVDTYGEGKAGFIRATLHVIQAGNMCSNTAEAFRTRVETSSRAGFFLAWVLAAPIAFMVKVMGGYREAA